MFISSISGQKLKIPQGKNEMKSHLSLTVNKIMHQFFVIRQTNINPIIFMLLNLHDNIPTWFNTLAEEILTVDTRKQNAYIYCFVLLLNMNKSI